ncbi:MAG: manganese transporter [Pirellulaceae bacterium]|nr:MAG: manganese transporter [Pirellulaceae bacterium]
MGTSQFEAGRRRFLGAVAAGGVGTLLACRHRPSHHPQPDDGSTAAQLRVTVTTGMIGDLVRLLGGPHLSVHQIMGAGTDPHLYKASRDDAAAILQADLVFYNGLMLEGKMSELLGQISAKKRAIAVAERLPDELLLDAPDAAGHKDPHVWMDVGLWSQVAEIIAQELSERDPENRSDYLSNLAALRAELAELDDYGRSLMHCIAPAQRVLVTSHDAFRYFGRAYDVEVEAVQGISTESEAGLTRINQLVDLIVERRIQAVFVESSVPRKSIDAVISGVASRGHRVTIGGTLYSDAMGPGGTYEGTYVGMMDHNFTTIAVHLGCPSAPAGGFRQWRKQAAPS